MSSSDEGTEAASGEETELETNAESVESASTQSKPPMSNGKLTSCAKAEEGSGKTTEATSASGKRKPKPISREIVEDPVEVTPSKSKVEQLGTASAPVSSIGKGQKVTGNKTYTQMIHDAIEALNDRTGSSMPAIKKWLLSQHSHLDDSKNFRHRINQGIKSGISQGRFEKVRCSFKISAYWKVNERIKKKKTAVAQAAAAKAKAKASEKAEKVEKVQEAPIPKTYKELVQYNKAKLRALGSSLSPEEVQKLKRQMRKKEDVLRKKEEAERKERERQERIKKRRFPMEDTRLHEEDKELCVKPPPDVLPRPSMPYFWQIVLPLGDPNRQKKASDQILRHSRVDSLDQGSRGLIPDLLQVYHFFRGDVHFNGSTASMEKVSSSNKRAKRGSGLLFEEQPKASLVPDFSLSHLIYATDEIINGNARRSRLIPPLISHLFVTCLQLLCRAPDDGETGVPGKDPQRFLQFELNKYLLPALTPGSWSDVCFLYMDAMDRFYNTDASRDPNVLVPLNTDLNYLFGRSDEPVIPMTPAPINKEGGSSGDTDAGPHALPEGYSSYLGPFGGALNRAHEKLGRSEAWSLQAEEMFALLRALTDDVLGSFHGISENIASREDEMHELLKAKKAADSKFRKVKLAFEGPKKPKKAPDGKDAITTNGEENGDANAAVDFKSSVSKKTFESAAKAQQKANDAYEKGIRELVARTEPVGYDRNHNAVYCFRHDPEVLYVEELRPPGNPSEHTLPLEYQLHRRSWYIIETTSLFEAFTSSLDIRGKREQDLYEAMLGPAGTQQSLRRYLHDDLKAKTEASSRRREREALEKRLEIAKLKCDEEKGRRSGRLADQAEEELARVQKEIDAFEQADLPPTSHEVSYEELTGLSLLRSYDQGTTRRETRRLKEKQEVATRLVALLPSSKLVPTGNIDGSGIVGMIVSQLLSLEESCQSVSPWEPDEKRKSWIAKVENAVSSWYNLNTTQIGPLISDPEMNPANGTCAVGESNSKKRRSMNPADPVAGMASISSVISSLKQPLLDLEARVADITNVAVAARDAEIADDNMSNDGSGDAEELDLAWKKELHRLRQTQTKQHLKVRERLVNALSLARKAHASEVVAKLRAALLLFHPGAAGESKKAGISVLDACGGYDGADVDEDADDEESGEEKPEQDETVSVLSAEAAVLTGCLGGSDEATRKDWIVLVKSCKTLSRLSSLTAAFANAAEKKLDSVSQERDLLLEALSTWQKDAAKSRSGKKKNRDPSDFTGLSEVWADVVFTDELCMAKAEAWPWWPAKICEAKDKALKDTLKELNRVLVALIGEMGALRIVTDNMIRPFTGEPILEEGGAEVLKKMQRTELEECISVARRIKRGAEKGKGRKGKS